jgi:thiol:disulfide interchange protein DsbD
MKTCLRLQIFHLSFLLLTFIVSLNLNHFSVAVAAEPEINENPLTATSAIEPAQIKAGGQGAVRIQIEIAPEHKAYVDQFKLETSSTAGIKIGGIQVEPTFTFDDKVSKRKREGVQGKAVVSAPLDIASNVKPGPYKLILELTYQACSHEYCLFPKTISLEANLEVLPSSGDSTVLEAGSNDFEKMMQKGLLSAFLFVFLAGVLTSFTPCIFPMIPITLAVIGAKTQNQSQSQSKWRGFTLSLAYVFGIAITYAIMGVIAARTGALFGSALGNPIVISLIAIIFVIMALSMYGVFEFRVPAFVSDRLSSTKTKTGYLGAFVTGLIAGVVASPCVGPVLVSILTFVAQSQNVVLGFFLLLTFALGIGQLFLVLGTFSSLTQKLPRSGGWMDGVKFFFGTSMIALALYYLNPVVSASTFEFLLGAALILISSSFGAFESNSKLESVPQKMNKAIMLTAFIVGIIYIALSLFGNRLQTSSRTSQNPSDTVAENFLKLDWRPYSDSALQAAKSKGTPVIIDFWADWCAACKELEVLTFTDERIREESKKFVLLKVNATNDNEEVQRLKKIYKVIGLPTMIFYSSKGEIRRHLTVTGFEKAEEFLGRMKKAL